MRDFKKEREKAEEKRLKEQKKRRKRKGQVTITVSLPKRVAKRALFSLLLSGIHPKNATDFARLCIEQLAKSGVDQPDVTFEHMLRRSLRKRLDEEQEKSFRYNK